MEGVVGRDIYWDKPSGQYMQCAYLCGSYPKACAEYCPDFRASQSQSSVAASEAVHETWQFIFIGVGVLALIPILAVLYLKRNWLFGHLRNVRGVYRVTDIEGDQVSTLLAHKGNTVVVHSTDDSRSNDPDTSYCTSSSGEQVPLVVKQQTAPLIEQTDDDYSYPVQETHTEPVTVQMDADLIDEPLTNACNSQLQNFIRFGSTKPIQENDVQPNPKVLPCGVEKLANCHPSNALETEFNNVVYETESPTKIYQSSETLFQSNETLSQSTDNLSQSNEILSHTTDLHCQSKMTETPTNDKLSQSTETISQTYETTEARVYAPQDLEDVLSTEPTEESGDEYRATNNLTSDAGAIRRVGDDSEQGIPDVSANSRADMAIDMTTHDRSLADTGPVEKQVMRPRYEREDSRQEVR